MKWIKNLVWGLIEHKVDAAITYRILCYDARLTREGQINQGPLGLREHDTTLPSSSRAPLGHKIGDSRLGK